MGRTSNQPGTCCIITPRVVFGAPARSWISTRNELAVISCTTNPPEVAAALALVVQFPTAGLFVPSVSS